MEFINDLYTKASFYLKRALKNPLAKFREGQFECIEEIMRNKRVLAVQRTGYGKTTEVKKDTVDNTETPFSLSSAPEEPVKRKSKSSKNTKKKKSKKEEMSDSFSEQGSFSFD